MGYDNSAYLQAGNAAVGQANAAASAVPSSTYQTGSSTQGQASQVGWNEDMSSAGRLNSMLSSGSPLMQTAALQGRQMAARAGLMNSTMGSEAAQKAMIESATPFATTDAQLFQQQQLANMQEANKWNTLDLDRMQQDKQYASQNALAYDQLQVEAKQRAAEMGLNWAGMQASERMELMKLSQQESQFSRGQAQEMTLAGMEFDLQDRRLSQDDKQFLQTLDLQRSELDAQINQFEQKIGLDREQMSQQDRQYYDGLVLERDKLEQQAEQFEADWENRFSFEKLAQDNRIDLTKIDADTKKEIANIEAEYRKDIAANENISQAWGLMVSEIGKINANPDMDDAAKRTNIQNMLNQFSSFTTFWKKTSGGDMDVSDLLQFGMTGGAPTTATSTATTGGGTGTNTSEGNGP